MQLLEAIDVHADGLKRAALEAGPTAPVRNCPKWTVHDLVSHIAFVHGFAVGLALNRPARPTPPPDWDDVLGWWDGQRLALREALGGNPETAAFSPYPGFAETVGDWTRRMAHETAIHRLDAESALADVPETRFSPEFANDGVDEYLTYLTPRRGITPDVRVTTPERSWAFGEPKAELDGAADDVYRALWGRPHQASVTGDLAPLAAP
ncbi:maleylpyruvate isomerase family mycothiol-dependent enzyme [Amycolatopsis sp. NPDC005961]|uniref:maleylpyruvate isomerase family mycothiol-dependent enzyme n=1 Tax=Amycolatopsis sp. NPDC005961 TaxID=3156720 RepID=UPI0033EF5987